VRVASLLPSPEWLVHAFVRSGIYRVVRHVPLPVVVLAVGAVVVLVMGRWVLRMRHVHRLRKREVERAAHR